MEEVINIYCIQAPSKEVLIQGIKDKTTEEFEKEFQAGKLNGANCYRLSITCPTCSKVYNYADYEDIPEKDVDCECGVHIINYENN